jgi:hypothetical protein
MKLPPTTTSERLAQVLHAVGLFEMEKKAREGYYDDFRSTLATPIMQLVADLMAAGQTDLARRAREGEFDATREEADAWFKREGQGLVDKVINQIRRPDRG